MIVKGQATEMEKLFAIHISHKGLVSRTHTLTHTLLQINKKTRNKNRKMSKQLEQAVYGRVFLNFQ